MPLLAHGKSIKDSSNLIPDSVTCDVFRFGLVANVAEYPKTWT